MKRLVIFGAAKYKSKIEFELNSISKQIDQHIIRLLLYPTSSYVDHWQHEIWKFLHDIDLVKRKNTYPSAKFIYDCLAVHNDILANYLKLVIDIEDQLTPRDVPADVVVKVVSEYQKWVAQQLSTTGIVLQKDVKAKLTELISSYL